MKFLEKNRLSLVVPLAAMGSVLFGMGVYFFQQREVFSTIASYTPPPKAESLTTEKPTASSSELLPQGRASDKEDPAEAVLKPPPGYEEPKSEELSKLLPEEIRGAVARDDGYLLTTSFGAKWYVTEAQVEQMPYEQQILIDYGRYKRENIKN
jgi:hypothetical protein